MYESIQSHGAVFELNLFSRCFIACRKVPGGNRGYFRHRVSI